MASRSVCNLAFKRCGKRLKTEPQTPPEDGTTNRKLAFCEIVESGNFSPPGPSPTGRGFLRVCRAVSWNHATTSGNPAAAVFIPRLAALYSRRLAVCRGGARPDRVGPLFRGAVWDSPVRRPPGSARDRKRQKLSRDPA